MWLKITLLALFLSVPGRPQDKHLFFSEQFDTVIPPKLPAGWHTTSNRGATGDFTVASSTPHSPPNAVLSTNATVWQCLISPVLDFTDEVPDTLSFSERRSASHTSGLLLEASTDSGRSYTITLSDTLKNPGTVSYIGRSFGLPRSLTDRSAVRIRWRVIGNGTGTTGTIRLDDIAIRSHASFGVSLGPIRCMPEDPTAGDSVIITAAVINTGIQPISTVRVSFYDDSDNDSIPEASERIGDLMIERVLPPGDTGLVECLREHLTAGVKTIIVETEIFTRRDTLRETRTRTLRVSLRSLSLIVNEIMYQPGAVGSEYIELYNRSAGTVDVSGMKICGARDADGRSAELPLGAGIRPVGPGGFFLVAAESSITRKFPSLSDTACHLVVLNRSRLGLNDNGTDIILRDASSRAIDSVRYSPLWHNSAIDDVTGRSLERVNPDLPGNDRMNWSTSASPEGGTPDAPNSIFTASVPARASLSMAPNPFSPDGDGMEDRTVISFELPFASAVIRIRIFDVKGRLIRLLAAQEPAGSRGSIDWDGYDDHRERLPVGIYIVLLEAIDAFSGNESQAKGLVVVAARM